MLKQEVWRREFVSLEPNLIRHIRQKEIKPQFVSYCLLFFYNLLQTAMASGRVNISELIRHLQQLSLDVEEMHVEYSTLTLLLLPWRIHRYVKEPKTRSSL
ncbi:hypothetical protein KOW79_010214 [Hemibagrus wyckioides]|uniref:Uncharacterized protein n=1 Tax=Hemibagrus wyckioides TaxID=337641 RepID=A0A9D3NPP5_9TELE|nr:hypothetical protein KOW79_010214 [Hemibagrus wyckioides]